jgi:anti-anti-sigma regulatory factor
VTELIIEVERAVEHDAYLVRASGWLGAWNRHDLRLAVQKCLVDLPAAVILDLGGLRLLDRLAAAVFVALRYDAVNSGPGIRVLMCGLDDEGLRQRNGRLLPEQGIMRPNRARSNRARSNRARPNRARPNRARPSESGPGREAEGFQYAEEM